MKSKKFFSFLCALVLMLVLFTSNRIHAEDIEPPVQTEVTEGNITSTGLIMSFSLSITSGTKTIYITARTTATDIMSKLGFTDISIQRSSNGVSNWIEEKTLNDDLGQNVVSYKKNSESVSVNGGYYYRVVLNHYAKETGWFFPSHESITNYSNVVWVPSS